MKKWECTICGYIHEGDEPPSECPVCGAGPEYFKEIVEEQEESLTEKAVQEPSSEEAGGDEKSGAGDSAKPTGLAALVLKYHLHPITVHTPNGVLPLAVVFLVLSMLFSLAGFETAAFYNLVFVLLTMPLVLLTGYLEWQNRYRGAKTKIFITKIGASMVVCGTLLAMVVWRLVDPQVAASTSRWIYLLIGIIMVGAAGLAGHLGGKLVFDSRGR